MSASHTAQSSLVASSCSNGNGAAARASLLTSGNNGSADVSVSNGGVKPALKRLRSTPDAHREIKRRASPDDDDERLKKMRGACHTILECLGEDPSREGLVKTPARMAKALLACTRGYEQSLSSIVNEAVFEEDHHEMILVKDIDIHSLCEHHMVPFTGKVHIAYIPRSKVRTAVCVACLL